MKGQRGGATVPLAPPGDGMDGQQPSGQNGAAEATGPSPAPVASETVSYDDPLAPAVTLDLPLLAVIPESYVPDQALRLRLYRRIAGLTDTASIDLLAEELADRFGPIPEELQNLLYQVRIKVLALRGGIMAIGRDGDQLVLRSDVLEQVDRQRLQARLGGLARVGRRALWMPLGDLSDEQWQDNLERILRVLYVAQS
jgi:transcription-repair coupling factor (superfamily II helicase)